MSVHNGAMKSGQALVVVLLILAVAAAVGLSIVSRSVNEVNLSTTQNDSSQALSAAESGIEAVLQNPAISAAPTPAVVSVGSNSTYSLVNSSAYGNTNLITLPNLLSGEYATIFLVNVNSDGSFPPTPTPFPISTSNINVCWGTASAVSTESPSLEVELYYKDTNGIYYVTQNGVDPANVPSGDNRNASNHFWKQVAGQCGGVNYPNATSFNFSNTSNWLKTGTAPFTPMFIRIRSLYNPTIAQPVVVQAASAGVNFPRQGTVYEVQGSAGQSNRRVSVTEKYPAPPGILDNTLYSGSNL